MIFALRLRLSAATFSANIFFRSGLFTYRWLLGISGTSLCFRMMSDQAVNKIILTQEGLSPHLCPDGLFVDAPFDELTVFLLSLSSLSAELAQHPVDGQAGMRRFLPGCRAVAAPLPRPRAFQPSLPGRDSAQHSGKPRADGCPSG